MRMRGQEPLPLSSRCTAAVFEFEWTGKVVDAVEILEGVLWELPERSQPAPVAVSHTSVKRGRTRVYAVRIETERQQLVEVIGAVNVGSLPPAKMVGPTSNNEPMAAYPTMIPVAEVRGGRLHVLPAPESIAASRPRCVENKVVPLLLARLALLGSSKP